MPNRILLIIAKAIGYTLISAGLVFYASTLGAKVLGIGILFVGVLVVTVAYFIIRQRNR